MTEHAAALRRYRKYLQYRLAYERKKRIYAIWCRFTLV